METAPTWCVACVVLFLTFAPLILVGAQATAIAVIFMLGSACGWVAACLNMRLNYDNRTGWRSILLLYHVAAALCLTIILLPFGLAVYYRTRRCIVHMQRDKAVHVARETIRRAMRHYHGRFRS